jgi:hypothetical protein
MEYTTCVIEGNDMLQLVTMRKTRNARTPLEIAEKSFEKKDGAGSFSVGATMETSRIIGCLGWRVSRFKVNFLYCCEQWKDAPMTFSVSMTFLF